MYSFMKSSNASTRGCFPAEVILIENPSDKDGKRIVPVEPAVAGVMRQFGTSEYFWSPLPIISTFKSSRPFKASGNVYSYCPAIVVMDVSIDGISPRLFKASFTTSTISYRGKSTGAIITLSPLAIAVVSTGENVAVALSAS